MAFSATNIPGFRQQAEETLPGMPCFGVKRAEPVSIKSERLSGLSCHPFPPYGMFPRIKTKALHRQGKDCAIKLYPKNVLIKFRETALDVQKIPT